MRVFTTSLAIAAVFTAAGSALADPCGMVPPVYNGPGPAITRVGQQQTYVFYKEGVESFVIRPSFSGKVDEFGMLIPFPTPPALRKVDDAIFSHIAMAVKPPEVVVDLRPRRWLRKGRRQFGGAKPAPAREGLKFKKDEVRVLKQEAVGMYEVAVLAAGSAKGLKKWMTDHGYRYPKGMDRVTQDYVNLGWCFVAVKTKVGTKSGVTPRPGMRSTNGKLPKGATFDGNVQAMGFRFKTDKLVVPMRLSAFNAGKLNNTVYLLTERPMKIDRIPARFVQTQLPGSVLVRHLTELLPLKILGGDMDDLSPRMLRNLKKRRDPNPKNGFARDLFLGDLEAVRRDVLALPHEEREKVLLRIGERLGLRGKELDKLHHEAQSNDAKRALLGVLPALKHMTLTVVRGDFPRDVLSEDNLTFSEYVKDGLDASTFPAPVKVKGTQAAPPPSTPDENEKNGTPNKGKSGSQGSHKAPHTPKTPETPNKSKSFFLRPALGLGLIGLLAFAGLRPTREEN